MTIHEWLRDASNELADNMFTSARLDAEIILAHTLKKPRTYLHAHGDEQLDDRTEEIANARLALRKDHVPIAYIIGHKEFYGRRFNVSPAVLIPRPETEQLITMLKTLLPATAPMPEVASKRLVDIGTGCGCLGITAAIEFPQLSVSLLDTSRHALSVAEKNAAMHDIHVETYVSDILASYPYAPDIVLANLPYVDESWERSPELAHEPSEALYAAEGGLSIITRCIEQCSHRIPSGGYLILEADPRQLDDIAAIAKKHGMRETDRDTFAICLQTT